VFEVLVNAQMVDVGSVSPENLGKLRQTFTAPMSGLLEVEIFNYNTDLPVSFDDWHIELTEESKPENSARNPLGRQSDTTLGAW
jgi:hypothetical protein